MKTSPKSSSGFTLIELIVVIVILGILSVSAAPKFLNFATDARISALKGLKGAIDSAMNITVAAAKIKGTQSLGPGFELLVLDGNNIILTPLGYPINWQSGLKYIVNVDENDWVVDPQTDTVKVRPKGIANTKECYFYYDASDATVRPELSTVTEQC